MSFAGNVWRKKTWLLPEIDPTMDIWL